MGTLQLKGKRTGRRPGSKSRPWLKAIRWALANLDRPQAVAPPSPLAGRLITLGRVRPDLLIGLLERSSNCPVQSSGPAVRSRELTMPAEEFIKFLEGGFRRYNAPEWLDQLPGSFDIIGLRLNRAADPLSPKMSIVFVEQPAGHPS